MRDIRCDVCGKQADGYYHEKAPGLVSLQWCEDHAAEMRPRADAAYAKAKGIWAENSRIICLKAWEQVRAAGLLLGDRVSYFAPALFGLGGMVHEGTLCSGKYGLPFVRMDHKAMTSRGYRKSIPWQPAWKKIGISISMLNQQKDKEAKP